MDLVEKTSPRAISKAFFGRPCPNESFCHFRGFLDLSYYGLACINTGVPFWRVVLR